LWKTPGYTPHAFTVHPTTDATARERVAQAMYEMADEPQGRALLAKLKLKGLERARNEDWDDVRALNIQLLK
jgi:phosphonate transport system substrate-binding protein